MWDFHLYNRVLLHCDVATFTYTYILYLQVIVGVPPLTIPDVYISLYKPQCQEIKLYLDSDKYQKTAIYHIMISLPTHTQPRTQAHTHTHTHTQSHLISHFLLFPS